MPLWGIDHWVPLGDLFVDVNILEELSSSRRSELDDLWQDFTTGNSNYRSLDRIGLGKELQRVSGLAVLERNTNLMVVGKPGSGKTTYLQRIVTECNDGKLQARRIPVLIKLREFVDDGRKYAYNLEQFLGQLWRLSNVDIELLLNQGRVLVLLDGLDEVTGEAGKQIAKEIKRFARVYPQVQVVVTCRTQSQESRFERFDYVEVADFNEEQVRAFAAHWFGTVCGDAGETKTREFLEQLFREENKPIRELAITPILLSLTCAVFQQTGKFYSKRSKLYEEGLELLLEKWDKSREIERDEIYRDLSVERKLELLTYVAMKKFEQQQYVLFEQEELEGYIGEFLGIERRDSRGVLRAIASQHGLLIERAQKVWSFSHLTFQEYLVAKWIDKFLYLLQHKINEKITFSGVIEKLQETLISWYCIDRKDKIVSQSFQSHFAWNLITNYYSEEANKLAADPDYCIDYFPGGLGPIDLLAISSREVYSVCVEIRELIDPDLSAIKYFKPHYKSNEIILNYIEKLLQPITKEKLNSIKAYYMNIKFLLKIVCTARGN